jgi:hypothetical protein
VPQGALQGGQAAHETGEDVVVDLTRTAASFKAKLVPEGTLEGHLAVT